MIMVSCGWLGVIIKRDFSQLSRTGVNICLTQDTLGGSAEELSKVLAI